MKIIVLDAGHGGRDSGAIGNDLREKDITLNLAKETKDYLDRNYQGHKTLLTRDKDIYLDLKDRTTIANINNADLFLSFHVNAGGGRGYESFIFNGTLTKNTINYSYIIHDNIIKNINVLNRGLKKASFYVLRNTNAPAILTETLFIDNQEDAKQLKDPSFFNKVVQGHSIGIAKALSLPKKTNQSHTSPTLYRVVVGSYKNKDNALKQVNYLKSKGIDSFILD